MTAAIRARAPLRVSFAGGGTDVPPFPQREGGAVLSATINRYAFASLRARADREIRVDSLDFASGIKFGIDEPVAFDGDLDLAKAAIRRLVRHSVGGFDISLHSNAPPGSGLGSSSAMVVALVGVLHSYYGVPLTPYEIANIACLAEREDLGIAGGLQDQYAAAFGGFNYIEFEADHVVVNPLRVDEETVRELEFRLVLAYTGRTRQSDGIIADQVQRFETGVESSMQALRAQRALAKSMKDALLRHQLDDIGEMLHEAWVYKQMMSPRISSPFIAEAYEEARSAGAIGGKVTGAGGGGYMIFYCADGTTHRVAEALVKCGLMVTDFGFSKQGVVAWRSNRRPAWIRLTRIAPPRTPRCSIRQWRKPLKS